jgi:hypothetical protein
MEYFARAGGDSTIDKRSAEKGCEYNDGYVSRRRSFEPRYCFISITGRHSEIHEDQIGTRRASQSTASLLRLSILDTIL